MLAALVLATSYAGKMTSSVIKPPTDDVLKTFEDLEKAKFTFIFDKKLIFGFIINSVRISVQKDFIPRNVLALKTLLERPIVKEDRFWFIQQMANQDKIATANGWPYLMWDVLESSRWMQANPSRFKQRKCYLGQEFVDSGERYFGFLPPHSKKLFAAYQKLFASGLMQKWEEEETMIAIPKSTQNRVGLKIKHKMAFLSADNRKTVVLTMEGKVTAIFLLWAICIVAGLTCFLTEKLFSYYYRI